jgi:predicted small lipoprotein YifL
MMRRPSLAIFALLAFALGGCGQKGPLYLPDKASEVVTRPAQPPPESTSAGSSPQTIDTPPAGATPAPEVTVPESDQAKDDEEKKDPASNEKGAAVPPR